MSSDHESEMPGPYTTPESDVPPEKFDIFHYNAHNPGFIPGYSVLRVERVKHISNSRDKTKLMNSIIDDLVATVTSINEYHKKGILSDENIFQFSTMMCTIGDNNRKIQARLDDKISSLKRQRSQLRADYRDLTRQMDAMGQQYTGKVKALEEQVKTLKKQLAWLEAGGPLRQSQSHTDERVDRRCVSEEPAKDGACIGQEQMAEDDADADGEWEESL